MPRQYPSQPVTVSPPIMDVHTSVVIVVEYPGGQEIVVPAAAVEVLVREGGVPRQYPSQPVTVSPLIMDVHTAVVIVVEYPGGQEIVVPRTGVAVWVGVERAGVVVPTQDPSQPVNVSPLITDVQWAVVVV